MSQLDINGEDEHLGEFFPSDEELLQMYQNEFGHTNALKQCIEGTSQSIYEQLYQLVLIVVIARINRILPLPSIVKNFFFIILGLNAIRIHIPDDRLFSTVLFTIFSLTFFAKVLRNSSKGVLVTAVGMLTIILLEVYVEEVSVVRGVLMVLVMKISSLSFDFCSKSKPTPSFFSILVYLLDPSTAIFGPFIRYEHFDSTSFISIKHEIKSLLRGAFCFLVALVCVVYSSCHGELVDVNAYIPDYFKAQSFRFSHYFICLFSQGLWIISGGSGYVTNPLPIELPRSLVDVVVEWNVPMHHYLRKYIFGYARGLGSGSAVFFTFLVSSLLHGLNFQLSAVLISLGFLCYGENALRNRLSSRLSSCIRSRACVSCNHIRKSRSPLSIFLNFFFSLLSIYHLIYLGMPFDGNSSASHALSVWSRHHFASHGIALLYIVFSWAI